MVFAVLLLVGLVWFLAGRTSRSSAAQESVANVAASLAPTMTGVLAASSTAFPVPSSPARTSGSAMVTKLAKSVPATKSAAGTRATSSMNEAITKAGPTKAAPTKAAPTKAAPTKATPTKPAPATTQAVPTKAVPKKAVEKKTVPTASKPAAKPPAPSFDAQGNLLCADADISVAAAPAAPAFQVGDKPRLLLTITNTGSRTCRRDVSGALQIFTVFGSDGTRVWSTTDCFPGEGAEVRELTPGQQVQFTIKWSGTTSSPGCASPRALAPAGNYTLVGQLGKLASPPAQFTITG
ncbi:MAG TPA: DUF4232 domain-containing protein [Nakamurella sp.]|nr:DUF4232 domain-containing protein [Nakamurella sp.]